MNKIQVVGPLGSQGRDFPQMSILPELFDGRGHPGGAQGCHMMGENGISHDRNS